MAQNRFAPGVKSFVSVDAPVIVLRHARVIDGTGVAPVENRFWCWIMAASPPSGRL
jgi:hypothetical protein